MATLAQYRKTIAAVVIGAIGWATQIVNSPSGPITSTEWIAGATALATALGVYAIANSPQPDA